MAVMLSDIVRAFMDAAQGTLQPGTCQQYARHFAAFIAATGDLPIGELKRHHLLSWAKKWHQLQALQRLMNWARDDGEMINRSPFGRIKLPASGERHRTLTTQDMDRFVAAANAAFRAYLIALRETIARPQEVRALRWEWLCWPGGPANFVAALSQGLAYFKLLKFKSRERCKNPNKPRVILVSPILGQMLVGLAGGVSGQQGLIFTNTVGNPWTSNALRCQMRRIRKELGFAPDETGEQICCYTFRHSGATAASAAGVRDRILAELLGHTSTRTTARYQHLDIGHLQAALERARKDGFGPL